MLHVRHVKPWARKSDIMRFSHNDVFPRIWGCIFVQVVGPLVGEGKQRTTAQTTGRVAGDTAKGTERNILVKG